MDGGARGAGFAASVVLRAGSRPLLRRSTCEGGCRRPARPLRARIVALQPNLIADVALVAGVISAGVFFLREKLTPTPLEPEDVAAQAESEAKAANAEMQQGVVGLRTLGKPDELQSAAKASSTRSGVAAAPLDDFMMEPDDSFGESGDSPRLSEELAWACGQVMDCGAGGVAVFNAEGNVIWSEGALVSAEQGDAGDIVRRVSQGKVKVACDCVAGASELPSCFSSEVVNIACLPVGDDGTVLAVASDQEGFYSSIQDRVCSAVSSRLQMFVFTNSFRNSQT